MRLVFSFTIIAALLLSGCADTNETDEVKLRIEFDKSGVAAMTLLLEGASFSCRSTTDNSAVFVLIANESDEPLVCDLSCVFGNPETKEESFVLGCEGVRISANTPETTYCRRNVGELQQSLGSAISFNHVCE